ncbi:D-alanine-D-alanine ligase [Seinonella peptonophila]|uniref:D-alanine--D-alanine ligase n=1 Tax=Seinonella peptonophila TaxID=112248 RepID=A0A1M4TV44_9BACL|nr:D-alanine--D-alanine ligase [Seinonella peptonophila]SHE48274.1 D-alanine-D-alanine ligase [Seinonella peptonophila]
MTKEKICVAILFGGKSGEHIVSHLSASSVFKAIDKQKYQVLPVGITETGDWKFAEQAFEMLQEYLEPTEIEQLREQLPPGFSNRNGQVFSLTDRDQIDIVFPVLHGTFGEDGTVQGLLEMLNLPYVGAGVLASSVSMDKVTTKTIFDQVGLNQVKYLWYYSAQIKTEEERFITEIEEEIGYPCFVKPANLGSSVGISKANTREELKSALRLAIEFDRKILIEQGVIAQEVEVAVLGNEQPKASVPGEIGGGNEFFDYEAKYFDEEQLFIHIPAEISETQTEIVREMALKAYSAVDGSGLARVDFFVRQDSGEILINEINTLPGFTEHSMYPKVWAHAGISYPELIDQLIELGLQRYAQKSQLRTKV